MSDHMKASKTFTLALALACVAAFAFAVTADDSSAASSDIEKAKEADWSGFTDAASGHFYVYLANNTDSDIEVKVVVYDGISGDEKDTTIKTIEGQATEQEVRMTFGYGSSGDKLVYYTVYAYNSETGETGDAYFSDGSFTIDVEHSMWKNTSTYVIIVVVILAIIIVAYFIMRSRANKHKEAAGTKTFTQLEAERKAKKSNKVAQKETYKSGEKKKRN